MSGLQALENFVREVYTEGATKRCPQKDDDFEEIPLKQSETNKQYQKINEHHEGAEENADEAWPELAEQNAQLNLKSCVPDWTIGL